MLIWDPELISKYNLTFKTKVTFVIKVYVTSSYRYLQFRFNCVIQNISI